MLIKNNYLLKSINFVYSVIIFTVYISYLTAFRIKEEKMPIRYYIYYLILINFTGFLAIISDKIKARFDWKRLQEKKFVFSALLGGGPGVLIGMYLFKHLIEPEKEYLRRWTINLCIAWVILIMLFYVYYLLRF